MYRRNCREIRNIGNNKLGFGSSLFKVFFFCRTYFRFTDPISGSIYVGECDSKRRKYGYGHCRFENGDLYHGLWKKDQMDEFGCYWWSNTGIVMCRVYQKVGFWVGF